MQRGFCPRRQTQSNDLTMRDTRYDILFTPLPIGLLLARNWFNQVTHCNGAGYRDLSATASMQGVKAEGGWATFVGHRYARELDVPDISDALPFRCEVMEINNTDAPLAE